MQARDEAGHETCEAFNRFCQGYWYPIYSFCRAQGLAKSEAEDATQSFFLKLISQRGLKNVDAARGRFRSFLLASFKNHLIDLHHHSHTQRRGGSVAHVPLDFAAAEEFISSCEAPTDTPENAYDRQWARITVDRALKQLEDEYKASGNDRLFAMLNANELAPSGVPWSYSEIGKELEMNEDAVKYQARVLRKRFQTLLREQVAPTVETPAEVDEELRYILSLLT